MKVLIAGANGLIGADAVSHYDRDRHEVYAADNNLRRELFGPPRDSCRKLERLRRTPEHFHHGAPDSRHRQKIPDLFNWERLDLDAYCAAQPLPAPPRS